jgi:hypothetical protein
MKFQSAIVSVALAMASVETSMAFTSPSSSSSSSVSQLSSSTRQQLQFSNVLSPVTSSNTALSVASSDIEEAVRRRKTRQVKNNANVMRWTAERDKKTGSLTQAFFSDFVILFRNVWKLPPRDCRCIASAFPSIMQM